MSDKQKLKKISAELKKAVKMHTSQHERLDKMAKGPSMMIPNVAGSLKNNMKVQEIGNNLFQGEQLAEQMQQRRTDDPVMPPTPDQMAPLYMDKTKYKAVNVQDLQDMGAVKSDKKGQYVVNENPKSVRDTLRFPKGTRHYSGKKYVTGQLIDESDFEDIIKKVNKSKVSIGVNMVEGKPQKEKPNRHHELKRKEQFNKRSEKAIKTINKIMAANPTILQPRRHKGFQGPN